MLLVLFDLGDTLESGGVLRPGARELLQELTDLRAGGRPAVVLGLLSDTRDPVDAADVAAVVAEYSALLDALGIRRFFEPLSRRVTLSAEVGVRKPAPAVFRAAVARAEPALTLSDVVFVSEHAGHVAAARRLGAAGVHLRPPGGAGGDVAGLPDLLPVLRDLVGAAAAHRRAPGTDPGGARTRLGEHVVVTRDAPPADEPSDREAGGVVAVDGAGAQRLFLVVQNGRLFQADHPEVPVLVDTGRHLVVDLEPEEAERLAGSGGACWALRPLPVGPVVTAVGPVVTAAPAPAAGREEPEWVRRCVARLSREELAADLATLAAHRTRHSASAGFDEAAAWGAAQLTAAGLTVTTQPVPRGGGRCRNVVADRPGTGPAPRDVVLVTAHLDSVNRLGAPAPAPGADDNASGSAGVLALARALAGSPSLLDLRLVLFGGEEQGLFGSRRYVEELPGPERARIRAVVNMDMIAGRNTAVPGVLLEGAAVFRDVIDGLARAAAAHTGLAVSVGLSPANSDHVPFTDVGIPAVLTIEGADGSNHRVHTEEDALAHVDLDLALEILRMNTAFVAGTLGRPEAEEPAGASPGSSGTVA
ncbi:M28 family peptidase [Geodermatophilus sp. URMC 62]|uniref:M28 family peptidase n=1 Tax=Geodermatophilus sp. URMC 62 TaxID=3423414 RepID=UPI00406C31B5